MYCHKRAIFSPAAFIWREIPSRLLTGVKIWGVVSSHTWFCHSFSCGSDELGQQGSDEQLRGSNISNNCKFWGNLYHFRKYFRKGLKWAKKPCDLSRASVRKNLYQSNSYRKKMCLSFMLIASSTAESMSYATCNKREQILEGEFFFPLNSIICKLSYGYWLYEMHQSQNTGGF